MLFTKNFWVETAQTLKSLFTKEGKRQAEYTKKLLNEISEEIGGKYADISIEEYLRLWVRAGREEELSRPYYEFIRGENWLRVDVAETGGIIIGRGEVMFYADNEDQMLRILYSKKQEGDQELILLCNKPC